MALLTRRYSIMIRSLATYWFFIPTARRSAGLNDIWLVLGPTLDCEPSSRWLRIGDAGSSSAGFDDHTCAGRAGHHVVLSGQHLRYPAERTCVRHLCGAADHDDANLDFIAVRRCRRLHRRCEPHL